MDHSNQLNKYATMYDQLKAIYGDDIDTMINVIYLSKHNESRTTAYRRVASEHEDRVERDAIRLFRMSGLFSLVSIPGWMYIYIRSIRRLLD